MFEEESGSKSNLASTENHSNSIDAQPGQVTTFNESELLKQRVFMNRNLKMYNQR